MFSPIEQKIIDILGSKSMTISEVSDEFYKGKKKPMYGNLTISNAVNRINSKCRIHCLKWRLHGVNCGRNGKTVKRGMK